jgi:type IV pilus assembly protein PilX
MRNRQRGMVLIVSLVMLLALTLLGLAAMQNSSLEERMAGNARAENLAFQATEAALRGGEAWMFARTAQPAAAASPGANEVWELYAPDPAPANRLSWWQEQDAVWWLADGVAYTGALPAGAAQVPQPHYVIEQAGFVGDSLVLGQQQDQVGRMFYQVTARGAAPGGRGEVLLRSTYARRF